MELSNIAYNHKTNQFGIILWDTEIGHKIMDCGVWPSDEMKRLSTEQAKMLMDYHYNNTDFCWNNPGKRDVELIMK